MSEKRVPFMTRWRSELEAAHLDRHDIDCVTHSVAVAFARYSKSDGSSVRVSYNTVADHVEISKRTVSRSMATLLALGFFSVVSRAKGGRGYVDSAGEFRCTIPKTPDTGDGTFAETPDTGDASYAVTPAKPMTNPRQTHDTGVTLTTGTTGTTKTTSGRDRHRPSVDDDPSGRDAASSMQPQSRFDIAVKKISDGWCVGYETQAGSMNYGTIPSRFFPDDFSGDVSTAARDFLLSAAASLESVGVSNGLAYLLTEQSLGMDDAAFATKVEIAWKKPSTLTRTNEPFKSVAF
jgi:hypothetical protein